MQLPDAARSEPDWAEDNRCYLEAQKTRIRLLLKRRILWLRQLWRQPQEPELRGLVISDSEADALLAGNDISAQLRFHREDPEAIEIARMILEAEAQAERLSRRWSESERPLSLVALSRLFGLTAFERDVVLLCLAPEIDTGFERLYAYAQDNATRQYPTIGLALELFGGQGAASLSARQALLPGGRLRHLRIVATDRAGSDESPLSISAPLRLEQRVLAFILGANGPQTPMREWLRPLPIHLLSASHKRLLDDLKWCLEVECKAGPWPLVNLYGPTGSQRAALAAALSVSIGLLPYRLNAARIPPSGADRRAVLEILEREAVLSQLAFFLDSGDAGPESGNADRDDLAEELNAFLIVASNDLLRTTRKSLNLEVKKPSTFEQTSIWKQVLDQVANSIDGEVEDLTQQFDFGASAIVEAVRSAQTRARIRESEESAPVTRPDLWRACREHTQGRLGLLAQKIVPCHSWEDIVLPADVYCQLREIADQVRHRSHVYETWGFGAKLTRGRGISALFSGGSGTGKTLAAEILAADLDLWLYRIDLSGVVSKYIGETEKNLRRVFDVAEQCGAILFFDEADALFGKRSEVKDSHDRYANIEINYLLQRMEDYRGLAILATNRKAHLDSAFLRRLRFLVDFPFPDRTIRAKIWQTVFPERAAADQLDFEAMSRLEITGGNIKNIAVNAAFLAAREAAPIANRHVFRAARREYAKIDKLVLESEFGSYYPEEA